MLPMVLGVIVGTLMDRGYTASPEEYAILKVWQQWARSNSSSYTSADIVEFWGLEEYQWRQGEYQIRFDYWPRFKARLHWNYD